MNIEKTKNNFNIAALSKDLLMKTTPADTARSVGKELGIEGFQESEEKYQMLLDGIRAYAIFMMDPHGRIISWNNGAERIKGYTAVLKQTRKI